MAELSQAPGRRQSPDPKWRPPSQPASIGGLLRKLGFLASGPVGARHLVGRNGSAGARRPALWTSPSATPPSLLPPAGGAGATWGHAGTPSPLSSLAFCLLVEETGSASLDPGSGSQVLCDPGRFIDHPVPRFLYFVGGWPGLNPLLGLLSAGMQT